MRGSNYQFSVGDLKFDSTLVNEKFKYEHPNNMIMQCLEIVTKRSKDEMLQMFNPSLGRQKWLLFIFSFEFILFAERWCLNSQLGFDTGLNFAKKLKLWRRVFSSERPKTCENFLKPRHSFKTSCLWISTSFSSVLASPGAQGTTESVTLAYPTYRHNECWDGSTTKVHQRSKF